MSRRARRLASPGVLNLTPAHALNPLPNAAFAATAGFVRIFSLCPAGGFFGERVKKVRQSIRVVRHPALTDPAHDGGNRLRISQKSQEIQ